MRASAAGLSLLLASLCCAPAVALEPADEAAGRAVIERQLGAFSRDDAAEAYGQATPAIREMFGSDAVFMDMVRRGYRPVYRARSHEFGETRKLGGGFEQLVRVLDEAGAEWDALYTLERQPDGSWRIAACRLIKRPGEAV